MSVNENKFDEVVVFKFFSTFYNLTMYHVATSSCYSGWNSGIIKNKAVV